LSSKRIAAFFGHLIILLLVTSCAHYQTNQALRDIHQNEAYTLERFNKPVGSDEIFVALTFSGGGTRAAALSYGVLDEMRRIKISGSDKTLLDEVDVISTVSGGSFTGAYYALFGKKIFEEFRTDFLYRNVEKELELKLLNPANWIRLASPNFSRIDLAYELYDRTIFDSKSFGDLANAGKRPFLIINATNLYQGARFEFTGEQFNYIGSNILSFPVAKAVAASSAFPFLLSPVTLVNYHYLSDYKMPDADRLALKDFWNNKERYLLAKNNTMFADKKDHPYVHLMDGGLADNIGLRAIGDLFLRGSIRRRLLNGEIKTLLVIVVNAKTEPPQTFDKKESPPGFATIALKTCTLSMDNYSFETIKAFRKEIDERVRAQQYIEDCQKEIDRHCSTSDKIKPLAGGNLKLYVVDLSFDNIPGKEKRDYLKALPTSFNLSKEQVDRLIDAGESLLREDPDLKEFLSDLTVKREEVQAGLLQ
jgi:NTE family protein